MPNSKKDAQETQPAEDIHRLYARAYGSRLAKQVADELDHSRHAAGSRKKPVPSGRT